MHPADIKASLEKAGEHQTSLAARLKVTRAAVHLVLKGKSKSQRIAEAISRATGTPVKDLWPGKYPALEKHQAIQARGGRAAVLQSSLQSPTPSEKKRA